MSGAPFYKWGAKYGCLIDRMVDSAWRWKPTTQGNTCWRAYKNRYYSSIYWKNCQAKWEKLLAQQSVAKHKSLFALPV